MEIAKRYIFTLLISLDQLGNTILAGDPDETLSSRAAKRQDVWGWRQLGRMLEWLDPGHLARSREDDEGKDGIA